MSEPSWFEIEELAFAYDRGADALAGVDLRFARESLLGLIGDNGAGKTTLISVLARHRRARSGVLRAPGGRPWDSLRIGWMASDDVALPKWPVGSFVGDVLGPTLGMSPALSRSRLDRLAEELGVADVLHKRPDQMSRGQRIRCALIAALIESPDLVLLDEPFLGLDPTATDRVCEVIAAERSEHGTTFLISDHRLEVLERSCDRWAFLVGGRIADTIARDSIATSGELANVYRSYVSGSRK